MNRATFFLIIALAAPLAANDIAVSAADGRSGWLLLESPYGDAGEGLSEYVTDPGMPAPDPLNWPHRQDIWDGSYPQTDLWHYDSRTRAYTRATDVLNADRSRAYPRTLYSVFTINGKPFVLHYDKQQSMKRGLSQVLRVDEQTANANGEVPVESIMMNSADFIDAPAVSPDGKLVAFRAFPVVTNNYRPTLRVYTIADWTLVMEAESHQFGRPVWIDNTALAVIAYDGDLPLAPQPDPKLRFSIQVLESHTPAPGTLLRADLTDSELVLSEMLSGEFPPDRYTRTLVRDPFGLGLVVARKDGESVVVEQREPKAGGEFKEIAHFEAYRGCSVAIGRIRCSGVRTIERARTFAISELWRWGEVTLPGTKIVKRLPVGDKSRLMEYPLPQVSPDGHGGLIDLGRGIAGLLEPVVNPKFDPKDDAGKRVQLLRHSLVVLSWSGCDTMRNPRVLQQLSKLVRRFTEIGKIRSTLLAFDIKIAANNGTNEKNGRYIELYSSAGRKGKGRIRISDNLGGKWLVQAADGDGTRARDDYYSYDGTPPKRAPVMDHKTANNAGKAYDDLITQLEARKLLMMSNVDADPEDGGLYFVRRDYYRDPNSGTTWRVWVYRKLGRIINEEEIDEVNKKINELTVALGNASDTEKKALEDEIAKQRQLLAKLDQGRESTEIRFVADLPTGSAGDWAFPHAIAQVQMKFALSNQRSAAITELTFEPDRWVALPHLTDLANGRKGAHADLLLPKVFRIYQRNEQGKLVEQLKATAVDKEFAHPVALVKAGKITPGYEVPRANFDFDNSQIVNVPR